MVAVAQTLAAVRRRRKVGLDPPLPKNATERIGMRMFIIASLYHFSRFDNPADLRGALLELCMANGLVGTILLAREGINGTVAGSRAGIDAVVAHIKLMPGCAEIVWKEIEAAEAPFRRMKVRVRPEIVTMGRPDVDPLAGVGTYVAPQDWNALIAAPDVAVIDTRNDYETAIGSFAGAIDPGTSSFGEFPGWWNQNRDRFAGKRIAMFCTGGIRCEKATNFLIGQGIAEVFHLQGGILKYLEEVPAEQSEWRGDCYVFDGRVAVGHGLVQGNYVLCHACGRPLAPLDLDHPLHEEGVACRRCASETTEADKAGFRERQRQLTLAKTRGTRHLGTA